MDDARAMRRVERVADLDRDPQRLAGGSGPARQTLGQRLAFEILQHQKANRVTSEAGSGRGPALADVVERADVRMIERRDRARFALEAVAELRIGRELRRQNFDRDRAIEARVARPIDFAHAARANERDDFIDAKLRSSRQGHAVNRLCA